MSEAGVGGDMQNVERLYARVAMMGALTILLVELLNGKSLVQLFGGGGGL
jgi:hypothetical protein